MSGDDHIQAASRAFAGNLKRIRRALGLSQSELAARCNLAPSHIAHFESRRRLPSMLNLLRIKHALGCSWEALLQ